MKTLLITGASGFIGQQLCRRLAGEGHRVIGVSRSPHGVAKAEFVSLALGQSLQTVLDRFHPEAVIHTANSVDPDQFSANVDGTLRWMKEAEAAEVVTQIYLGSASGHESNTGEYGRAKFIVEEEFLNRGHWVLKLGLVVGPGGFFGKLAEMVRSRPLIPLLDGGMDSLYWTHLEWVLRAISLIIGEQAPVGRKKLHLVPERTTHLREVLSIVREQQGSSARFLPLPSSLLYYPALALEKLHLRVLPFSSASVRSSRENAKLHWPSDLSVLGIPPVTLEQSVRGAL